MVHTCSSTIVPLIICMQLPLKGSWFASISMTVVGMLQAEFNATLAGSTPPNATETWTSYTLTFNGTCASNYLTNYGKSGPVGRGLSLVDNSGIRSTYGNTTMMMGPAGVATSG